MWYAKYNNVSLNGFETTVIVTVKYYSDLNDSALHESIHLTPDRVDSEEFKNYVQQRLAELNEKQSLLDGTGIDIPKLTDKPIGDAPSPKEVQPASVLSE